MKMDQTYDFGTSIFVGINIQLVQHQQLGGLWGTGEPASNLFAQEIWYEVVAHLPLSKSRAPRLATMVRDIGFGWVWYGLILHYGINDMTIVAALIQI